MFAFCDREQDRGDCIKLNPSKTELLELREWLMARDENPGWSQHVDASLQSLAKDLGYDI